MKKINWQVRLANKTFWLTAIPAFALLVQAILQVFGIKYDFGDLVNNLLVVVNTAFAFLVILGLVNDPTTKGLSDSEKAMTYTEPK
ncbi:phage holin [Streptococcus canis]|uniref:phage holin n=1 Tax=Streptococcus TaxID=1301 RepID=UPI002B3F94F7|nr:phage holin [Streptococcus pyogenes]